MNRVVGNANAIHSYLARLTCKPGFKNLGFLLGNFSIDLDHVLILLGCCIKTWIDL
ncbi:MAG: hypothetical protein ACFFCS_18090 [Candidatus Hodarchaeota archaeon]